MISGAAGPLAFAAGSDTIRVGVIGCGGRGSGAAKNCADSSPGVKIVALADAFGDRLQGLKKNFNVPDDRCFVGLDAYKQVLALAGREPGHPGDAAGLPADSSGRGDPGRQERLHGKARLRVSRRVSRW